MGSLTGGTDNVAVIDLLRLARLSVYSRFEAIGSQNHCLTGFRRYIPPESAYRRCARACWPASTFWTVFMKLRNLAIIEKHVGRTRELA